MNSPEEVLAAAILREYVIPRQSHAEISVANTWRNQRLAEAIARYADPEYPAQVVVDRYGKIVLNLVVSAEYLAEHFDPAF